MKKGIDIQEIQHILLQDQRQFDRTVAELKSKVAISAPKKINK